MSRLRIGGSSFLSPIGPILLFSTRPIGPKLCSLESFSAAPRESEHAKRTNQIPSNTGKFFHWALSEKRILILPAATPQPTEYLPRNNSFLFLQDARNNYFLVSQNPPSQIDPLLHTLRNSIPTIGRLFRQFATSPLGRNVRKLYLPSIPFLYAHKRVLPPTSHRDRENTEQFNPNSKREACVHSTNNKLYLLNLGLLFVYSCRTLRKSFNT